MKEIGFNEKKRTISFIVHHKNEFEVDLNYQREKVWTTDMKQYLIDTILKGLDISRIYVRVEGSKYYIIDGQQRLNAIWEFADNVFPLSSKYSGNLGGKYYKDLPVEVRESFDEYNVTIVYLTGFNDEEIRDIYRRINTGVPLNTAERLNAYPGKIVDTMRKIAKHPFFEKVCELHRRKRYRAYHVAAQLMLLEKRGITDISPKNLYKFFDDEKDLDENSATCKKIIKTLNYLTRAFDTLTMELRKPSWIITTYLLTSHLLDGYVMDGKENKLKNFVIDFYRRVANSSKTGDEELIEFNLAISRGTTSEKNIRYRHKVIFRHFLLYAPDLIPRDPKRDFTEEERIVVFRRAGGRCQKCGKKLDMKNFHVHHKIPHSKGGKTVLNNAILLCESCHKKLHGGNSN